MAQICYVGKFRWLRTMSSGNVFVGRRNDSNQNIQRDCIWRLRNGRVALCVRVLIRRADTINQNGVLFDKPSASNRAEHARARDIKSFHVLLLFAAAAGMGCVSKLVFPLWICRAPAPSLLLLQLSHFPILFVVCPLFLCVFLSFFLATTPMRPWISD
jgi:hypothetical protein